MAQKKNDMYLLVADISTGGDQSGKFIYINIYIYIYSFIYAACIWSFYVFLVGWRYERTDNHNWQGLQGTGDRILDLISTGDLTKTVAKVPKNCSNGI